VGLSQLGTDWLRPFPKSEFVVPIVIGVFVVFSWWRVVIVRRGYEHPLSRTSVVSLRSDPSSAFDLAKSAAKRMGLSIILLDHENGVIVARRGATWRSFGEFLRIEVKQGPGNGSKCLCKSWPTSDLALLDWGASRQLIAGFVDYLKGEDPGVFGGSSPVERSRHP
jgi:hypothetical protein